MGDVSQVHTVIHHLASLLVKGSCWVEVKGFGKRDPQTSAALLALWDSCILTGQPIANDERRQVNFTGVSTVRADRFFDLCF